MREPAVSSLARLLYVHPIYLLGESLHRIGERIDPRGRVNNPIIKGIKIIFYRRIRDCMVKAFIENDNRNIRCGRIGMKNG